MIREKSERFVPFAVSAELTPVGVSAAERRALADYLQSRETLLTERVVAYASTRSYSHLVSTLPEAWRSSVQGLTDSVILMLDHQQPEAAIDYDAGIGTDPSTAYGIEAGLRHRLRGISLETFIGAFKGYREVYLNVAAEARVPAAMREGWLRLLRGFFDRAEVGICAHWSGELAHLDHDQLLSANRALVNEKNKYLTIFESMNNPVLLVDDGGRIENMNFAAARLFLQDALPGSVYYGPEANLSFADVAGFDLETLKLRGEAGDVLTSIGERWFSITAQEMLDVSRKFAGIVVTFHDVTEARRAREQAEALARAKTDFLATMSHEIRTPIHSIGGVTELLKQAELAPRDRGYVDAIERSTEVLASIVSDVLDYARIESGLVELEQVDFSIDQILDDVARMMQPLVRRKPQLRFVIERTDLPPVVGDAGKLRQILINLTSNAVKFTAEGTVVVGAERLACGHRFRFTVSDTGPGIAAEKLEEIFKPYIQSDSSISRRHGGTGLGLAICRRLAGHLGGRLDVRSTPGFGSRFTLEVALAPGGSLPSDDATAVVPPPARALDLLVVEDDEVNALVAQSLLSAAGHGVRLAGTGEAALVALGEQRFDLVLTDLNLPDMDGLELARAIRRRADRHTAELPLVALSARGPGVDPVALTEAGIDAFLGKPFHFARLEEILCRLVGSSSPTPLGKAEPAGPAPRALPSVDLGVLRGHAEALGCTSAARIVRTFRQSVLETARALERAMEEADMRSVASLAHRLKGSARHLGFTGLSDRAEQVETAAAAEGCEAALVLALVADCRAAPALADLAWAEASAGVAEG
ncbi:two-component system sensor histidine kinase DorS [Cereibacter johrii]|uniref:histidine kinase n=1 Tax=Cereibacter johrii TaxID=445629 RepID=A0ABX5JAF4_9RHOB|nr:ATP-binding protein [Cereibacter johrii]ODM42769.1 hybrid sensor histidine kinase/response regulator [Cereibacter johrii]PTM78098.1 PAS domain-containing protein [Cereibacter johrii]